MIWLPTGHSGVHLNSLKSIRAFQIELELIWKFWFLRREEKRSTPRKNLSKQEREQTTISTHIWRRRKDWNPGHKGGSWGECSHRRNTLALSYLIHDWGSAQQFYPEKWTICKIILCFDWLKRNAVSYLYVTAYTCKIWHLCSTNQKL